MKVDMNYRFKNLEGKDVKEQIIDEDEKGNPKRDKDGFPVLKLGGPVTLRNICIEVLVNPVVDMDPTTRRPVEIAAEKKLIAWNLAQRIHASDGLIDLKSDAIELLKKAINKRYGSPQTVAQAFAVLDPMAEEKETPEKK